MNESVERLFQAREQGERVAIVGDYDVDGVSGTALLVAVLSACGIAVEAILPNRLVDGYGFRAPQVERAKEAGCSVIVTVDCGTTSAPAVAMAREEGLEVIITDHHLPSSDLPTETLQINPRQQECSYPFADLSGAGLALKLAQAVAHRCGRDTPIEPLLRVACLGTIADLVPLVGENRIIASLGLKALEQTRSLGLRALMRTSRVRPPFRASDVGFRLGPRLNAAGRLRRPDEALELLLTRDEDRANRLAEELDQCNTERRAEEVKAASEAHKLFAERDPLPQILVGWSETWHRGVVGIAASRIARAFHRPTVLLAIDGDEAVGSGRSVPGISLHAFLVQWEEELERFGGHAQAIGMSVAVDKLESLREHWESMANWPEELLRRREHYELELDPSEVNEELLAELRSFEPHGMDNPQPILRVGPLTATSPPREFGRGHLKLRASGDSGGEVNLLCWKREGQPAPDFSGRFEVLARLEWDSYVRAPVLEIQAARPMGG